MPREVSAKRVVADDMPRPVQMRDGANDVYDDATSSTLADVSAGYDNAGKKAKLLRLLKEINLPPMPPLDEILHELGHDTVAEMTGRNIRLRRQLDGLYRIEPRAKDSNFYEHKVFLPVYASILMGVCTYVCNTVPNTSFTSPTLSF